MFIAGAGTSGRTGRRSQRWRRFEVAGYGFVQFQPSELAKLALVLFAADVLARREGKLDWVYRAGPVLIAMGLFVVLILKQPDMGTAVVLCCIGGAVLFAAGMPVLPMLALGAVGGLAGYLLASSVELPSGPAHVVPKPFRACEHNGVPIGPGPHSARRGALGRHRDRPELGELGLPA